MPDRREIWWKNPVRAIQLNLQVRDTPKMNPEKIAREIAEAGGNALVVNTSGIYAWYPSKVRFHHVNEYLPDEGDLLKDIITECHKNNVRIIARHDYSKAEDIVYQQRPGWFVRLPDGSPKVYGRDRPGAWSRLMCTCINAGYRNEDVAIPAIRELLNQYDVDGVFFNAPHYEFCTCDACKQKYYEVYGEQFPGTVTVSGNEGYMEVPKELPDEWPFLCLEQNMSKLYAVVKEIKPDAAVVLYHSGHKGDALADRLKTADLVCAEPQDTLSKGWRNVPSSSAPAISMRVSQSLPKAPASFGIIHSCPGIDWRHVGIPTAEYAYWLSMIPANGGMIWHSLTGFPDTIHDKRIMETVSWVNHNIQKLEGDMQGAKFISQVVLLHSPGADGIAHAMVSRQIPFDIRRDSGIDPQDIAAYQVVILAGDYVVSDDLAEALKDYVANGGSLLIEGDMPHPLLADVMGIKGKTPSGQYQYASYFRIEDDLIRAGLENIRYFPHQGVNRAIEPCAGTETLVSFVPPFATLDSAGVPPERASILCEHTDVPLCTVRSFGKGSAMYVGFDLGCLSAEFRMPEHSKLYSNLIRRLIGEKEFFHVDAPVGVQATLYQKSNLLLVHLVNGVGQRPLADTVPVYGLQIKLAVEKKIVSIKSLLEKVDLAYSYVDGKLLITTEKLVIWDCIRIEIR